MQGLIVDTRDGRRRSFQWNAGTIKFGSGVDSDLVLSAPGIADRHGAFEMTAQGCRVVVGADATPIDLNGAPTRDATIRAGDVLRIGPFQLAFSEAAARAPAPAAAARPAAAAPAAAAAPVRRDSGGSRVPDRDAVVMEQMVRRERASARARAKSAGQGGPHSEGMKVVAVITGLIAFGLVGFLFFGGNPWSKLAEGNYKSQISAAKIHMKNCHFDQAYELLDKIAEDDRDDVQTAVKDARKELSDVKKAYAAAELEFETLKQKADSMTPANFERLAAIYMNNYQRRFPPLFDKAYDLNQLVKSGKYVPSGIHVTEKPEAEKEDPADFEAHGAAPGFGGRKKGKGEN